VSAALILDDILVWSLQIGLLIAAASLFPPLLRLKMPKSKLAFRQLVLLACLLLPFVRAWKQEAVAGMVTVATAVVSVAHAPAARAFPAVSLASMVLALVAGGILVRLGLLLSGFLRLRRYRLRSLPLEAACSSSSWAVEAELRISAEIASPVTFGFRKPVVLLPTGFPTLSEGMRDAILCHEILHVRRHDWLFTAVEEFVRALLWFHPAVWWLMRDIQLVREQTVDREVVKMTRARDQYIDALLVIAGAPPQIDLAPAPLFLRKRHLKQRVVSILKEGPMPQTTSRAKSVSALAASLAMLAASGWFITGVFPLQAAPQVVADAPGVSVGTGTAQLMHRQAVEYPPDAIAKGVSGTVVVQVKLDGGGNVTDASAVSGPEELRKAVLQSVLNWHFTSDAAFSTRQVSVSFDVPKGDAPKRPQVVSTPMRVAVVPPPVAPPVVLKSITVTGLSDQQRDRLLALLSVREGDPVNDAMIRGVAETLHAFDEHLAFRIVGSTLNISTPEVPGTGGGVRGGVQTIPQTLRIGGNIQQANLITKVPPIYPPLAKAAHVEGTVRFEVTIGRDGTVQNVQLISGPPLLVQAAMEGVQQWVYKPTLLNGSPVPVITNVDVNFTLTQ
jgi:TonB family protein